MKFTLWQLDVQRDADRNTVVHGRSQDALGVVIECSQQLKAQIHFLKNYSNHYCNTSKTFTKYFVD